MLRYLLIVLYLQKIKNTTRGNEMVILHSKIDDFCLKTREIYNKYKEDGNELNCFEKLDIKNLGLTPLTKRIELDINDKSEYYISKTNTSFKKNEKYFFSYFFCDDYWIIKSEEFKKKFWENNLRICSKFKKKKIIKNSSLKREISIFALKNDSKEYLKISSIHEFKSLEKMKKEFENLEKFNFRDIYKGLVCIDIEEEEEDFQKEFSFIYKQEKFNVFQLVYYFDITNKGLLLIENVIKTSCDEENYQSILLDKIFSCLSIFHNENYNIFEVVNLVFDPDLKMYSVPFMENNQINSKQIKSFLDILLKFSKICTKDLRFNKILFKHMKIVTKYVEKLFDDVEIRDPNKFDEWKKFKNVLLKIFNLNNIKTGVCEFDVFFENINYDDLTEKKNPDSGILDIRREARLKITDMNVKEEEFSKSDDLEIIEKLFYANQNYLKILFVFINIIFFIIF